MAARKPAARMDREARIDHILVAARDLFRERGYEAVSMCEIAGRVGVVEGLLYKYFATKRALLMAVLTHWYEDLFGDYTRELAGIEGHRERLYRLIWRHLRAVRDDPRLCHLMFREVQSERDYHGTELHRLNRRYTSLLLQVITAGVSAGAFRADLPPTLLVTADDDPMRDETHAYAARLREAGVPVTEAVLPGQTGWPCSWCSSPSSTAGRRSCPCPPAPVST